MPEEKMSPSSPQLAIVEHQGVAVALSAKEVASIYKKSRQSGIPFDTLEEVYRRGYSTWTPDLKETPTQTAFNRVNSFIAEGAAAAMDSDLINEKRGLWDNIHAKRERIKHGSGERMRKPGEKGAPTAAAIKASQTEESDPCWDGYKQVGMKTKKGRKVPNCVPEERYMGAEKASNDPNDPTSRFVGDARVYMKDTPGQEVNLKFLEGGSKLKTIKRIVKEACSCEKEDSGEPKSGESVKAALKRMNDLKTPEERAEFLNNYVKSALGKGGFTDDRFKNMNDSMKKKTNIQEGDRVKSSNVKDIVMNSPYGTAVSMLGLQNRLEPKTVEAYARSVGVPVSGGVIGPASASSLSKNIKKVYNYDVSPEKIKGYANTFGLTVGEAYNIVECMIIEEVQNIEEKWSDSKYKSPSGGMTRAGVRAFRRENPGSKLQTAVTTKPSKLKKGSKAAKRRKSFCARMGGMKKRLTSAKTARDPDSRINKALRKWNC